MIRYFNTGNWFYSLSNSFKILKLTSPRQNHRVIDKKIRNFYFEPELEICKLKS
jgi:hypothetical protein